MTVILQETLSYTLQVELNCAYKPVQKFRGVNINPISIENEKKALEYLKMRCKKNLSEYPDSYEHDIELLKTKTLTYNERNCLIFRSSEKNVYYFND